MQSCSEAGTPVLFTALSPELLQYLRLRVEGMKPQAYQLL